MPIKPRWHGAWASGAVALGLAVGLAGSAATAAPPPDDTPALLLASPLAPPGKPDGRHAVTRSRIVDINPAARARLAWRGPQRFQFNLFDNARFTATVTSLEIRCADSFTCAGELLDPAGGRFVAAVEDGVLVAVIWADDRRSYEIRPGAGGHALVQQIDPRKLAGCGCGPQQQVTSDRLRQQRRGAAKIGAPTMDDRPPQAATDDCELSLDVMVLYTERARLALGSPSAMRAFIYASVAASNIACQNSGVAARFKLVHAAEVKYLESGVMATDLARLQTNGDDYMDEVFPLRDQYHPDLISLLVNPITGPCGVAYVMTDPAPEFRDFAFSVVQQMCALSNLTFPHELAHNLGCHHDWSDPSPGAFPYSHGLRFTGASGQPWRTIMAASPGARIPHFSNPNILFDGVPTGVPEGQPNPADNARTINNTVAIASSFQAPALNDCNNNGNPDGCDIIQGISLDLNENGVPDECDAPPCPAIDLATLAANDPESFDQFGGAVAMSDTRAVLGASFDNDLGPNSGSAYVFRKLGEPNNSKASGWVQEAKLTAGDGFLFQQFGNAVAISADDNLIIVGAYRDGLTLSDVGAAYIFRREGTNWVQEARIANPDPEQSDWFGWSVAFIGGSSADARIVIGAPLDNERGNNAGALYVYRRIGTTWELEFKIMADDAMPGDQLGYAVACAPGTGSGGNGARILAGAPSVDGAALNTGAAYVLRDEGGGVKGRGSAGSGWVQEAKLLAADAEMDDRLGASVAINAGRALIGAAGDDDFGDRSGAAYVFRCNDTQWTQEAKLHAANAAVQKQFGASVAISGGAGERAVIGSLLDVVSNAACGSVSIFTRSGGGWVQQARIAPADGAAYDNFGVSVAIAPGGAQAVAGAWFDDQHGAIDAGSARVFALDTLGPDCNANGQPDSCDIANGYSLDKNANGVPDECESPPGGCPADIAGNDGEVNVNDLLMVIDGWGTCTPPCPPLPCTADITRNCTVDVADLQAVIENWGPCR